MKLLKFNIMLLKIIIIFSLNFIQQKTHFLHVIYRYKKEKKEIESVLDKNS